MIKRSLSWIFSNFISLKFSIDLLSLPLIIILAYSLKFKLGWLAQNVLSLQLGQIYDHAQVEPYVMLSLPATLIFVLTFKFMGLYRPYVGTMGIVDELINLTKAITIAILQLMALTWLIKTLPESRSVLAYSWALSILILSIIRLWLWRIESFGLSRGIGTQSAIIVGANEHGQDIAERMIVHPSYRLTYIGNIDNHQPTDLNYHIQSRYRHLGRLSELTSLIQTHKPDIVYLTTTLTKSQRKTLYEHCLEHDIILKLLSDTSDLIPNSLILENFEGLPFIATLKPQHSHWQLTLKHTLDFLISLIAIITLTPIFIIIAIGIKLSSPNGPVFFTQTRVTKNNQEFEMIKFRTMRSDAEATSGPVHVAKHDTRIFPFGQFLRQTSLDELPQLFNMLKGEMSIIGPRPERPHFIDEFNKDIPYFKHRHNMRAGLTGWAQVNGRAYLTSRPKIKLKYDLYYIYNWSLIFDLKIFLKTFLVVFKREEAY